ncbi:phosphomannomutase-like [Dioscorea cayenensis subsp. rotundata]|uniref:Phosphomannomutase n=1 Tax=Dioscorea cayennensis subsp. rotundata TaxID=55577 RepID=A0AB40C409_DIOCR|nr:phosphomannomutase-like [Dioscorea cayenensis subsp. rotundata]
MEKVEESIGKIDPSIKEAAYHAWLGYYNSIMVRTTDHRDLCGTGSEAISVCQLSLNPDRLSCHDLGLYLDPGLVRLRENWDFSLDLRFVSLPSTPIQFSCESAQSLVVISSESKLIERSLLSMAGRKPAYCFCLMWMGRLLAPRKRCLEFMKKLREVVTVGVVGGSDLVKISEQLGKIRSVINDYDYVFSENGLVAYKNGELIGCQSLKSFLGEEKLKEFINFTLHYIADLDIPIKRGTFIEFRSGMLNVSPIGRNCSQEERDDFEKYDKVHNVRQKMVSVLREKFAHLNLTFSIGGQISFEGIFLYYLVFPQGWDKTYCLRYLNDFQEIHFFGDKTYKGGNDFEIYESERTVGHTVTSPKDTAEQCSSLFLKK